VKSKWLSPRSLVLHVCLVAWLAMCAGAAWWQVGRAVQGNSLSFMYSIEWPLFGILGVLGWYAMLNMETVSAAKEAERREYEERMRAEAQAARQVAAEQEAEDPALARYNDHLADLATKTKRKLWGH
jgi:DNA-binding transcriptional regulator of glucitol operon